MPLLSLIKRNRDKLILHLCAGTGSDSEPYFRHGYKIMPVREYQDIRLFNPSRVEDPVYGIIANPPCTHFAASGARWWKKKGTRMLFHGLSLVDACFRVICLCNERQRLKFWMMENPVGRLPDYIGPPRLIYQPYEYGDPYTKRTCLWGRFNIPPKLPNPVVPKEGSKMNNISPSIYREDERSMCSPAFAEAFFKANQ